MELLDSRRLTGPNILSDLPGAIIDVRIDDAEMAAFVAAWTTAVQGMLSAVGWKDCAIHVREMDGGVSVGFDAPVDALYAATEVNDWAYEEARRTLAGEEPSDADGAAARLEALIGEEESTGLMALRTAALENDLPFLSDDDHVSVGYGRYSRTWDVNAIPNPDDVPWDQFASIPVGMVTGTNGKTTTVRLAAAMLGAAGRVVGTSSTDRISVGEDIVDEGDYSGPGGARTILRDTRVDVAVLETARGGLLRRGAAVTHADAAVVTNIAADHLDDFGVRDLEALADVKWIVTRVVGLTGRVILNADDERLVKRSEKLDCMITWFGLDPDNQILIDHRDAGGVVVTVEGGSILAHEGEVCHHLATIDRVPIAFGGAATHNIANAMAAAGLALALGASPRAIGEALESTESLSNPGRCNVFTFNGASVIVDFAHNPHGVAALGGVVEKLGTRRRILLTGQAGDRGDDTIRDLARAAWGLKPDRTLIKEMAHYARGRGKKEVANLIRETLVSEGADPASIEHVEYEIDAVRMALDWLEPGDLAIVLVHEDIKAVLELIGSVADKK